MSHKIFGIGLNKTGTKTLGYCLRYLGFRHKSFDPELTLELAKGRTDRIVASAIDFDSFEDWPWPLVYRDLDVAYPGSLFIMTTRRTPEIWYDSLLRHAERTGPTEFRKIAYGYDMPHGHEIDHITRYLSHMSSAREYFVNRPNRFLEVCWESGDGWEKLCTFLDRPVPETPFPHLNRRPL